MYKASIIVTISNEYALTENFFKNLFQIINDDINIFTVVDGKQMLKPYVFCRNCKIIIPIFPLFLRMKTSVFLKPIISVRFDPNPRI